jgi:hypothetical protein
MFLYLSLLVSAVGIPGQVTPQGFPPSGTPGKAAGFGAPVQPGPPEPFHLSVPGQGWVLSFEAPPLTAFSGQSTRSGFQFRGSWPGGYSVTITSETAAGTTTRHEDAYERFWPLAQRGPTIDPASLKVEKSGGRYVKVTYRARSFSPTTLGGGAGKAAAGASPTAPGAAASYPHANYYFVVRGHLVDVHVWRTTAGSDDQEHLARFERTLNYREGGGGR